MKNYLPSFVLNDDSEPEHADVYRQMGVMILLDIDCLAEEKSEPSIGEYFESCLERLKSRNFFLAFDEQDRPIGYLSWKINSDDRPNVATITHQSAPFDNNLEIFRQFQNKFPKLSLFDMHCEVRSKR